MNDLTAQLYGEITKANQPRAFKQWHASSIAKCPKYQYLARQGVPYTNVATGAKMLRWQVGHSVEATIRGYLEKIFPRMISNLRMFDAGLDLTGEIDAYAPDSRTLISVKSVHPNAVRYKKVSETRHHLRDDKPYIHHEWQEHAYTPLLAKLDMEVDNIVYLYISLSGLLVPYSTPVKPGITQAVLERLNVLNTSWAAQTAPDCVCKEGQPMYKETNQYCDYKNAMGCCDEN